MTIVIGSQPDEELLGGFDARERAASVGPGPHHETDVAVASQVLWKTMVKRAIDIVVASVLLILSLPVMLMAALAIKLHDGGPVLFRHERVGRDGRRFMLYKLRTMVPDAEQQRSRLQDDNGREGPLFKLHYDPRVTRVGRFLRASSIDEFPQLLSVLRGTMSMVGPRPALPAEVAQFDDGLLNRLRVPPGLTGLWQIKSRDDPSFHRYRELDLFYVEHWSIRLDLSILIATVTVVVNRSLRALRPRAVGMDRPVVLD